MSVKPPNGKPKNTICPRTLGMVRQVSSASGGGGSSGGGPPFLFPDKCYGNDCPAFEYRSVGDARYEWRCTAVGGPWRPFEREER
jgi:hypothetical protein